MSSRTTRRALKLHRLAFHPESMVCADCAPAREFLIAQCRVSRAITLALRVLHAAQAPREEKS
jgi:hypothetical protein